MSRAFTQAQADALAAGLDLGLDDGICHACLSFVSFALDAADQGEIARQLRRVTPDLWDEGLAAPALAAVGRARDLGLADASEALVDLERNGGKSTVARSIVKRLAEDLSRRTRAEMQIETVARSRLLLSPPNLN